MAQIRYRREGRAGEQEIAGIVTDGAEEAICSYPEQATTTALMQVMYVIGMGFSKRTQRHVRSSKKFGGQTRQSGRGGAHPYQAAGKSLSDRQGRTEADTGDCRCVNG